MAVQEVRSTRKQKGAKPILRASRGVTSSHRRTAADLQNSILKLDRVIRQASQSNGESTIELQILELIDSHPGATQADLAAFERVSRPTISVHIKKLAKRRYIRRPSAESEQLGKQVPLYLTPVGRAFLRRSISPQQDWLTKRLDALDGRQQKYLIAASRSLRAVLEDPSVQADAGAL